MTLPHAATQRSQNLVYLDVYRGLAALAVVGLHGVPFLGDWWPRSGYIAVDFFFLISGMVIARSYDGRLGDRSLSAAAFVRLRVIRFYPIYLAGAVGAYLVAVAAFYTGRETMFGGVGEMTGVLALTLAFIPHKVGEVGTIFALNAPYWSLFFELLINIAFVALWPVLKGWRLTVFVILATFGLILAGWSIGSLEGGHSWETLHVGVARVTFSFFAGVWIIRSIAPGGRRSDGVLVGSGALLLALLWVDPGPWRLFFDLAAAMIVFPLFAVLAVRFQANRTGETVGRLLGDTSYGIYALHVPAMGIILGGLAVVGLRESLPQPFSFVGFVAVLLVAVWVLHHFYDVPLRRWLIASGKRRATSAESVATLQNGDDKSVLGG